MAINKKLIHFKNKSKFTEELANNNINDTSICFIQDTQEIWTHGQLYNCASIPAAVTEATVSGWGFTKNAGTVTGIKINGTTKNPSSGVVNLGTVITSHQTLKTINGESIVGSGDITISGGSSGSSAYPEVSHGTADTTFELTPNTFHVWDEVTELDLSLGAETAGVANEYLFQFTSGSTATTLSLPDDIKWANDDAPAIETNKIYQISILKGLGSVLEFKNIGKLIENTLTIISGDVGVSTFTFEYPVASDVTLQYINTFGDSGTSIIKIGTQSAETDFEPGNEEIISVDIIPNSDNTYIYTL